MSRASMTRSAPVAASPSPMAAIRPSRTATSAVRPGAPVPSMTVPPRMRSVLIG